LPLWPLPCARQGQRQVQAPVWGSQIRGEGLHRGLELQLLHLHLALHDTLRVKRALQADGL
jgi:hypothetical protein